MDYIPWARQLRLWRKRLGLSQQAAAVELGVAEITVASWETGKRHPIREDALKLVLEIVERRILAERSGALTPDPIAASIKAMG